MENKDVLGALKLTRSMSNNFLRTSAFIIILHPSFPYLNQTSKC